MVTGGVSCVVCGGGLWICSGFLIYIYIYILIYIYIYISMLFLLFLMIGLESICMIESMIEFEDMFIHLYFSYCLAKPRFC